MARSQGTFVQRLIRWRFLFVVNLMIVIFLSLSLGREVVRNKTIASEIAVLEAQAGQLITENLAISELQSALQSESFIEREARLKLGMKKPGEGVVVIQDRIDGQVVNSGESDPFGFVIDPEAEVVEDVSNTSKWWYYFFDKTNYDRHQSS